MKRSLICSMALAISVFSIGQATLAQESVEGVASISTSTYPTALSQRPFTLPAMSAEFGGKMSVGATTDSLALDFVHLSLGVTDDLQFGLSWTGFQITKLAPARALNASAGYFLFANNWAASMAYLETPIYFDGRILRSISFAAPTAFPIIKNVSVLAFYDSLVDFSFADGKYAASFNFPVQLGWQVTPKLALDVSTRLAKFEVGTGRENSYIWNVTPIKVKGLYALTNVFDIVASAGVGDLSHSRDSFSIMVGAQYRIGV